MIQEGQKRRGDHHERQIRQSQLTAVLHRRWMLTYESQTFTAPYLSVALTYSSPRRGCLPVYFKALDSGRIQGAVSTYSSVRRTGCLLTGVTCSRYL